MKADNSIAIRVQGLTLHGAIHGGNMMSFPIDMAILVAFCIGLFMISLHNIRRRWIA